MLVLSRKLGEKIYIGEDGPDQIRITVVDIGRGRIRLGIEAARHIPVYRQELRPFTPPPAPTTDNLPSQLETP